MRRQVLCILLIAMLFAPIVEACFFYRPSPYLDDDLLLPSQKALIIHNQGQQKLILQVKHEGPQGDFSFIVPTPNLPEVEGASANIFDQLHQITQPRVKDSPSVFSGSMMVSAGMAGSRFLGSVDVHSREQIGVFDVSVISSQDSTSLLDWLSVNGYLVPAEAKPIIESYVDQGWYFVAQKVDLTQPNNELIESLKEIDESITDKESAQQILTQLIVEAIITEKKYDEIPELSKTIDQSSEDRSGDIYGGVRAARAPTRLITQSEYETIAQAYHGLYEENMRAQIRQKVSRMVQSAIRVTSSSACQLTSYIQEDCQVWLWDGDEQEVEIIRGSQCADYCQTLNDATDTYTPEELAQVAAQAIIEGDQEIRERYNVYDTEQEWYEKEADLRDHYARQIRSDLLREKRGESNRLSNEKLTEFIQNFNEQNNLNLQTRDQLTQYVVDKTIQDLEQGLEPQQALIAQSELLAMDYGEYRDLLARHDGDQDRQAMQEEASEQVNEVISWNQESTQEQLNQGTIQPLQISFETPEPILPFKLTQLAKGDSEVLVYLVSANKLDAANYDFKTEYAQKLETESIGGYGFSPWGYRSSNELIEQIVDAGMNEFTLTKLRADISSKKATQDIQFGKHEDDDAVRITVLQDGYWWGWLFFLIGQVFFTFFNSLLVLLPRIVLNKIIFRNKESRYRMTWKQHWSYAALPSIVIIFFFFLDAIGLNIDFNFLSGFFEFIAKIIPLPYELLRFAFVPTFLSAIISFALWITILYGSLHLINLGVWSLLDRYRR